MIENKIATNKNVFQFFGYFILLVAIILNLINSIFTYAFLVLSFAYMLIVPSNKVLELLFFLLPFDAVIKVDPKSTSFFTIVALLAFIIIVIKRKAFSFDMKKLFPLSVLIMLLAIVGFHYLRIIKLVLGFFIIFIFFDNFNNKLLKNAIIAFSVAMILSSILFTFSDYLPRMVEMIKLEINHWTPEGSVKRFSGLAGDPNYYSLDLFLAITGLWYVYRRKIIKTNVFYPLFLTLSAFGILTLSKSYILVYFVFLVLVYIVTLKANIKKAALLGGVFVFATILAYIMFKDYFSIYVERLTSSFENGFDINSFTTGRWSIWESYWEAITLNTKTLLFGNGLNAGYVNKKAQHNAYVEALYHFGFVGTFLFIVCVIKIARTGEKRHYKGLENFIPLIIILSLIFALAFVLSNDIYYFLCIIFGCIYCKKREGIYESNG